MKREIKNIMKWSKINGKTIYICFAIEGLISIILASFITWNKKYGDDQSMFQLQTPIFLLGGLIGFCVLDCMSFFGRPYERQMLRMILASDSLFFLKRYLFFGMIFALFSLPVSGLMTTNSNTSIGWSFYITFIIASIISAGLYSWIATIILVIKKQWIFRILIILMLLQMLSISLSLYPFFVEGINPWIFNSIGVFFPIFSSISAFHEVAFAPHLSSMVPVLTTIIFIISSVFIFHKKTKWNTKKLF